MKTTPPIVVFLLFIITLSCQSEYERQLAKGKDLVEKEMTHKYHSPETTLELNKYAQLSGNKRRFNIELKSYETHLQQRQVATKYP